MGHIINSVRFRLSITLLIFIGLLAFAIFSSLQTIATLVAAEEDVNIAGSQRARSLQMALLAEEIADVSDSTETQLLVTELENIMTQFDQIQLLLREGDESLNLAGVESVELLEAIDAVDAEWSGYRNTLNNYIATSSLEQRQTLLPEVTVQANNVFDRANELVNAFIADSARVEAAEQQTLIILSAGTAVMSVLAAFIIYRIVVQFGNLVNNAQALADGALDTRANTNALAEIANVGVAFNQMAQQLQALISGLEIQVANRTRDLQTVVDVNNQVSTILETDRLLQDVVDLTKERFGVYHAHIYLYDPESDQLKLSAGAGHVGRQMVAEKRTIDFDNRQSIVAEAARSRRDVIIQDVTESPTFLPHPLLPDTHSELAVPLISRGQVLGVLDIQSAAIGYFDEDMLGVMMLLANQIATALSNARLYETASRVSRHEQALGTIERQIQNAVDIDDLLQTAVRELGKALRVPHTAIELKLSQAAKAEAQQPVVVPQPNPTASD